jgi:type I restriction enzyme M protein
MTKSIENLEKRLWKAADQLRANSELRSNEYSVPVLGLIFLRYADIKFTKAIEKYGDDKLDITAAGVLYVPETARFSYLLSLPESAKIGQAVNAAMLSIEAENESLKGVLPQTYTRIDDKILIELLKDFNAVEINGDEGDIFGKIYEYFLGNFAQSEGQGGGEFFTPISLVRLIVEIVEPWHGRIYDPACGSGGMFVQSADFVNAHQKSANQELSVWGQELTTETARLAKMNLAVHGLEGDIKQGNTYYDDRHDSLGKFDFVMANPPFNVDGVDKERIKKDPRYPFGIPRVDNGNYLWIQHFYSALNNQGRAGFVMANSASDARSSELEIRQRLIKSKAVDVMVAVGPNMFYTVTLPCALWFLDKKKKGTDREDKVLFIDAREIFHQIDRAHREFTSQQIEFIANIVNFYRNHTEVPEFIHDSEQLFKKYGMSTEHYQDVPGLCKVATIGEIEAQGWSLNPARYVGVRDEHVYISHEDFIAKMNQLHEEIDKLHMESNSLANTIQTNWKKLIK